MTGLFLTALWLVLLTGIVWNYVNEVKDWNGGVSSDSGLPWIQFDTDSQGGQMYTDGAGNNCCISWTHITKDTRNVR